MPHPLTLKTTPSRGGSNATPACVRSTSDRPHNVWRDNNGRETASVQSQCSETLRNINSVYYQGNGLIYR
eukprot:5799889-Pyramimonas_sp.AAC.1